MGKIEIHKHSTAESIPTELALGKYFSNYKYLAKNMLFER
jgi:hypothetical protein